MARTARKPRKRRGYMIVAVDVVEVLPALAAARFLVNGELVTGRLHVALPSSDPHTSASSLRDGMI